MHNDAMLAIKAAKGFKAWGYWAARKFVAKNNVPLSLVRLARQLEAV